MDGSPSRYRWCPECRDYVNPDRYLTPLGCLPGVMILALWLLLLYQIGALEHPLGQALAFAGLISMGWFAQRASHEECPRCHSRNLGTERS